MGRRWRAGDGFRAIARATRIDRKTVAPCVRATVVVGLTRGGPAPTDAQIAAVRHHFTVDLAPPPSAEMQALAPYREQIRAWLTKDQLRLTKIYWRLRALQVSVSYSTLYRFARAQCDFGHANGPRIGPGAVMLLNWKPQSTHLLTGKYSTPSAYM